MTPISVLLVDDNPTFLQIAARFLMQHDDVILVDVCNGGRQALEKAAALHPQVVLIDLAMYDLPGLQAIPRLRTLLPEAGIIALTLLDANSYRQAALLAGADDFVPKAALNTELLPAIHRVMSGKSQPQE